MKPKDWSEAEVNKLKDWREKGMSNHDIATNLNRTYDSVSTKIKTMKFNGELITSKVPQSTFPKLNKPLKSSGDALIISDLEAPFQHSEFVNRVLDLADAWGVQTLHLAGDLLHYDRLSSWGEGWQGENEDMQKIMDWILQNTTAKKSREAMDLIENLKCDGGDLTDEMNAARKVFASFNSFKHILVAIGNHDDRFMRALSVGMKPIELLVQIEVSKDPRWEIAQYYYTELKTDRGLYRIEHPRSCAQKAAIDLAVQYHCHIIMGHSHRWAVNLDPSAKYWAIQQGHAVDEERLAYVMQRSAKRDAHRLGATIVRDGYPWVLNTDSPFETMKRM
jgi:hypothetical protein